MRDINRIDKFCELLKECWKKYPDWRFGQMVCNLQRAIGQDGFYIEDDEWMSILREYFDIIAGFARPQ